MVELCDTAYHAGVWEHNQDSIGIECRPEMSKGDLETVCELVAELFQTYGVMPVIGHCDVYATACPGRYYDKLDYIYNRALEIMNQGEQEEVEDDWMSEFSKEDLKYLHTLCENHKAKECSDWAKEEMKAAIKAGITDGTRPLDAVTRQEAACMALRGNVTK